MGVTNLRFLSVECLLNSLQKHRLHCHDVTNKVMRVRFAVDAQGRIFSIARRNFDDDGPVVDTNQSTRWPLASTRCL